MYSYLLHVPEDIEDDILFELQGYRCQDINRQTDCPVFCWTISSVCLSPPTFSRFPLLSLICWC